MTTEEAIQWFEARNKATTMPGARKMAEMAIAALRAQQERENPEPLTLDELREMGGKPVFIQYCKLARPGKWKVIQYVTDQEVGFTDNTSLYLPKSSPAVPCYGKAWLAYRHKPEEDAK